MLHKLQTEQANFSPRRMHFELGVTNMRLYRLELAADHPAEAANYFSSAQSEFSTAGMKDVSADKLKKAAETADANEAKYYNAVAAVTKPKVEQESATSSKVSP